MEQDQEFVPFFFLMTSLSNKTLLRKDQPSYHAFVSLFNKTVLKMCCKLSGVTVWNLFNCVKYEHQPQSNGRMTASVTQQRNLQT